MFDIEIVKTLLTSLGYTIAEEKDLLCISGNTGITVSIRKDSIEGIRASSGMLELHIAGLNSITFDSEGIVHGAIAKWKPKSILP